MHPLQLRIENVIGVPGRRNDVDMRASTSRFVQRTLALAKVGESTRVILDKQSDGTMTAFCTVENPMASRLVMSIRSGNAVSYNVGGLYNQQWVIREADACDCKDYAELVVDKLLALNRRSVKTLESIRKKLDEEAKRRANSYDVLREAWAREGLEAGI